MKIAHIICVFRPYKGGMGNTAANFASVLAQKGHHVTIITPDYGQADFFSAENDPTYEVLRLKPLFAIGNAACLPQLAWKLRDYDIVHLHYPFYGAVLPVLAASLFKKKGSKLVIHYHMDSLAAGLRGLIFQLNRLLVWPIAFKACDLVTAASLDYVSHSQIASSYAKRPEKFRQVPFGVDTERFNFTPLPANGPKNILFVGGLDKAHYFKGISVLLEAFHKLRIKHGLDCRLTLVGSGDLQPSYADRALELGISQHVSFAGNCSDQELVEHYRRSSVLVLPSINQGEAFGLVLLEAMSSGRPVIASDLPGVRGVFSDRVEGLSVKPGDADDLADKLLLLLSDEAMSTSMSQQARKRAETDYRWSTVGDLLEKSYR